MAQKNDGPAALTDEAKLPALTLEQMETFRRFAMFEADIEDLRISLGDRFQFDFDSGVRTAESHFRVPEPGIVITQAHIANALERKRTGIISERDLVRWATMLLVNDAYALDPGDEDLIAEWLNDLSLNLDSTQL
jgi:hypothetical protein